MGKHLFRGDDQSVPVYDTFATLVDTIYFDNITLCSPAFQMITCALSNFLPRSFIGCILKSSKRLTLSDQAIMVRILLKSDSFVRFMHAI